MMTTQALSPADLSRVDPDWSMGLQLLAEQRRARLIQMAKVGIVWVVLIAGMTFILLQLNVEPGYMVDHYGIVLQGLVTTIGISVISICIASILALLGALGRISRNSIARGVAGFYVSLIRGTPLLIQIYLIYLGLPQIGTALIQRGFPALGNLFILDAVPAGILALSLNYGAYLTEVFRAGIQAVPKGQNEAAWAIGLSGWQTQRRIILPQAFKIVIPAVGNDFIALIKDTSLVSVITVEELLRRSQLAGAATFSFMSTLLVAAAW